MPVDVQLLVIGAISILLAVAIVLVTELPTRKREAVEPNSGDGGHDDSGDAPEVVHYLALMTYNVLTTEGGCTSGPLSWAERKNYLLDNISEHHPDVMVCQETTIGQIEAIANHLGDEYDWFANMRRGTSQNEYTPIFYNKSRVEPVSTPTTAKYSQQDPGCDPTETYPRLYSYAKFKFIPNNKEFWFFGTHMPRKDCPVLQQQDNEELINVIKSKVQVGETYFVGADWNNSGTYKADVEMQAELGLYSPAVLRTHYHTSSCEFSPADNPEPQTPLDRILSSIPAAVDNSLAKGSFGSGQWPASDHAGWFVRYQLP